ncbi:MAG: TetR/AcrR family transcriptional regulator C-terminal domain-containing protein [Lachnospiraceae bacterium]|nr:TetR/AcrR family transcriptional regulator C-terminal domain-containing protein [Lachnospiraceae bacterium]MDY4970754.1 TetR/AcrR family transcriptional regulator C-terminal domain-containing protein [Lachnospiraceae bacterium]
MKNEEISLLTKQKLALSLKKAMEKKPLSKVTVSELIKDCNINRNTFYYHFSDIYDLLKWMLEQEAIDVVKKIDLLIDTEEAIRFVMDYIDTNRHMINCAYDSMGRDEMKRFFYADFIGVMKNVIDSGERQLQLTISAEFKNFIAEFYTEALAGLIISWLKNDHTPDREQFIQNILFVCRTSIPHMLRKEAEKENNITQHLPGL